MGRTPRTNRELRISGNAPLHSARLNCGSKCLGMRAGKIRRRTPCRNQQGRVDQDQCDRMPKLQTGSSDVLHLFDDQMGKFMPDGLKQAF